MKKLFICIIPLFIHLAGCGSDSESKGKIIGLDELDQEKAKEAILDGVIELEIHDIEGNNYSKSDIVDIEICEAFNINDNDGFTGNFISFWKTNDSDEQHRFVINNDYEMENIPNFERIEDRCVSLD